MNRALNLGVIFAIHVCFLGDHGEPFDLVIREHHGNRDVRRIASSGDNDSADSRLIVPGIKAKPATA